MTVVNKRKFFQLIGVPTLIFIACILITFTAKYKADPELLNLPLLFDLLLSAPLAYYLVLRRTTVSKQTVLRVFMIGLILAGTILTKDSSGILAMVRKWIFPLTELTLISFLVFKFYKANRKAKTLLQTPDFLTHCRAILAITFGSEKLANIFATEVAVFYYLFSRKNKSVGNGLSFSGYKENGILLVLATILFLFIVETTGMHFVFQLWNKTLAWILTILSGYTCLQLFAHTRALKARVNVIEHNNLFLRNGLLGGDLVVAISNINRVEYNPKLPVGETPVKLALLKRLESHNIIFYFNQPVVVLKAFGIKRTTKVLLMFIDDPKTFIEALEKQKNNINADLTTGPGV